MSNSENIVENDKESCGETNIWASLGIWPDDVILVPSLKRILKNTVSVPVVVLKNDSTCLYEPSDRSSVESVYEYLSEVSFISSIGFSPAEIKTA